MNRIGRRMMCIAQGALIHNPGVAKASGLDCVATATGDGGAENHCVAIRDGSPRTGQAEHTRG